MSTPEIELPVARVVAATTGTEREVLESVLEYYRAAVKRKVVGVSDEDLRRSVVPSPTTLGGLLKHLAVVERRWFQEGLSQGEPTDRSVAANWTIGPQDSITALLAEYDRACAESREIADRLSLDAVSAGERGRVSLRWVYVHMIDETARHAGHADIIRELIDGSTGDG